VLVPQLRTSPSRQIGANYLNPEQRRGPASKLAFALLLKFYGQQTGTPSIQLVALSVK
jgi:hypothetical protein